DGAAAAAEERLGEEERRDPEISGAKRPQEVVGGVGRVMGADAGRVPPDDEVAAPVVLPDERVEDRLARSGVAHGARERGEEDAVRREVVLDERLVAAEAHVGRQVVLLRLADERVDEQALDQLERAFLDVLVRAVDGVPRLEADHRAPAALGESGARLGGIEAKLLEAGERRPRDQLDAPGEQHLAAPPQVGDAGMARVFGAVDQPRLLAAIPPVLLRELEEAERLPPRGGERDRAALDRKSTRLN